MQNAIIFISLIALTSAAFNEITKNNVDLFKYSPNDVFTLTEDIDDDKPPVLYNGENTNAKTELLENYNAGKKFKYQLKTQNGIDIQQAGQLKDSKTFVVSGQYSFTGVDGKRYKTRYTADELGYHPMTELDIDMPEAFATQIPIKETKFQFLNQKFNTDDFFIKPISVSTVAKKPTVSPVGGFGSAFGAAGSEFDAGLGSSYGSGSNLGSGSNFGSGTGSGFGPGSSSGSGLASGSNFGSGSNSGFGPGSSYNSYSSNTGSSLGSSSGLGLGASSNLGSSTGLGFGSGSGSGSGSNFGSGTGSGFGPGSTSNSGIASGSNFGSGSNSGFGPGSSYNSYSSNTGSSLGSSSGLGSGASSTLGSSASSVLQPGYGSVSSLGSGSGSAFGSGSTFGSGLGSESGLGSQQNNYVSSELQAPYSPQGSGSPSGSTGFLNGSGQGAVDNSFSAELNANHAVNGYNYAPPSNQYLPPQSFE